MARPEENPFWLFSWNVYHQAGVAAACLGLQDRHGLDVNLLLYSCWAGSRGHTLGPARIAELADCVEAWQTEVVVPLRRARRYLKAQAEPAAKSLRQAIQDLELQAEKLEQDRLFEAFELATGEPAPAGAARNLLTYLDYRGISPHGQDLAALATLITVSFRLDRVTAERLLAEG